MRHTSRSFTVEVKRSRMRADASPAGPSAWSREPPMAPASSSLSWEELLQRLPAAPAGQDSPAASPPAPERQETERTGRRVLPSLLPAEGLFPDNDQSVEETAGMSTDEKEPEPRRPRRTRTAAANGEARNAAAAPSQADDMPMAVNLPDHGAVDLEAGSHESGSHETDIHQAVTSEAEAQESSVHESSVHEPPAHESPAHEAAEDEALFHTAHAPAIRALVEAHLRDHPAGESEPEHAEEQHRPVAKRRRQDFWKRRLRLRMGHD
ncbi:hypothetical protein FHS82_000876 [Pseudochelatococcus lubricantis]|uniref:Uncharacterized protein n=1 Tax=Pseudochelatococcus lubricantis TaxID=1538102 RepID=A0ABX0UYN8_9HYPH|nr:hypothetical protein [Pseudochelatococcus lubricantis]NIJ57050.1 hypothetical protein [Pseudochelatococcus lubricantis]